MHGLRCSGRVALPDAEPVYQTLHGLEMLKGSGPALMRQEFGCLSNFGVGISGEPSSPARVAPLGL